MLEYNVEKQVSFVDSLSKRELNKLYPYGSYCDVKTHVVTSPMPTGYVEKARKRYSINRDKVNVPQVRLRTGKEDTIYKLK